MKKIATASSLKKVFSSMLFLAAMTIGLVSNAQAQASYKVTTGSSLEVKGTSNIHDWTMNAKTLTADAALVVDGAQVTEINALNFVLTVKNLKGKEDLLSTRAYKAMKEDAHKTITFKMTNGSVSQNIIKVNGTLTIAGVSKPIALQAKATVNADGTVTCVGSRKLKMSDFSIAPPSYMLGALKVADDITINYNLKLKN